MRAIQRSKLNVDVLRLLDSVLRPAVRAEFTGVIPDWSVSRLRRHLESVFKEAEKKQLFTAKILRMEEVLRTSTLEIELNVQPFSKRHYLHVKLSVAIPAGAHARHYKMEVEEVLPDVANA